MELLKRSFKSFSQKEKGLGVFLLVIWMLSGTWLYFGTEAGSSAQSKVYNEGVVGQIQHINPVFTELSEADADIASLVFSGLVKYNSETGEFEEDMATHTLSENQLTYTFTLKNDLFWQDGVELTAKDLYYTFHDVIQSEDFENPILKSNFDGVKVEMPNSRSLIFTLGTPNSFFFTGLSVGILPEHILGQVPVAELDTNEFNQNPIGSGPYKVKDSYQMNSDGSTSVVLARSDSYYGDSGGLEQIRFIAYPSLDELIAHRDVWHGAARMRASILDEVNLDDLVAHQYELPQYTALFINTDMPIFSKNSARLALAQGIDKSELLKAIGYKVTIETPILELSELKGAPTFDLAAAKALLSESGFDSTQVVRLLRRDFSGSNEVQENIMKKTSDLLISQLAAMGITLKVETASDSDLEQRIAKRDYELLLYGQSLGYNLDTFSFWHSSQSQEGGLNLSNYSNPKADALIEKIRSTFDDEERHEDLELLAQVISKDVPAVFLYTPSYYYLVDSKLTGFDFKKLLLPKDRFANISEWLFN